MTTYQFTCARRNPNGELTILPGLITPPVTVNTPTEAIHHPETVTFCKTNNCVVYEVS